MDLHESYPGMLICKHPDTPTPGNPRYPGTRVCTHIHGYPGTRAQKMVRKVCRTLEYQKKHSPHHSICFDKFFTTMRYPLVRTNLYRENSHTMLFGGRYTEIATKKVILERFE
jgi:hypothetical protein